ncbi:hypothetical protein [Novipirellula artificiosorum]|nr:hypothetical protein [Novipirellula artificiosorum]
MTDSPILFCHFDNSRYLPYVLETARLTNPDKPIILLGDEKNRWIGPAKGIDHLLYRDFDYGHLIEQFDRLYRTVQGPLHRHMRGRVDWLKFVFKRWFYVYNFLVEHDHPSFWHFDSDTMVLVSLREHESKFDAYDCTEQCNGDCLNGFVPDASFLLRFLNFINVLFGDEAFLQQKQRFFDEQEPTFSFNEMSAFAELKKRQTVKSIRLNTTIDGSTFDDCLCQEHGMEMERIFTEKEIKKVRCSDRGEFFCFDAESRESIRLNTLNLSWVPVETFEVVSHQVKKCSEKLSTGPGKPIDQMPTISELLWKQHFYSCLLGNLRAKTRSFRKRAH